MDRLKMYGFVSRKKKIETIPRSLAKKLVDEVNGIVNVTQFTQNTAETG